MRNEGKEEEEGRILLLYSSVSAADVFLFFQKTTKIIKSPFSSSLS